MAPLSGDLPKPMMPLWGIPLIEHILDIIAEWGVRHVLINLHHHPQPIVEWCLRRRSAMPRLDLSFEPDILGTGGALKRAAGFLDTEPFWMINTDIAFDLDPSPLIRDFHRHQPLATLWMHATEGPRTVELHPDGSIANFHSSKPRQPGTFTFCGLHLLSPAILRFLPDPPFCSVIDGYRTALQQSIAVRGVSINGAFWADLGTPGSYLAAHRAILDARRFHRCGARLLRLSEQRRMRRDFPRAFDPGGFAAIGHDTHIPDDAMLTDCVLWNDVRVHPGAILSNAIAGTATEVHGVLHESTLVRADRELPDSVLTAALRALRRDPTRAMLATLPARGSNRTFQRIHAGHQSAILIRYDAAQRPENARYAGHARVLATHGVRVPKIILDLPDHNATLFEDAGQHSLQQLAPHMPRASRMKVYRRVIAQLATLHAIPIDGLPALEPPFSKDLFRWESDLFETHFLRDLRLLAPAEIRRIHAELASITAGLADQPHVLLHRDFQSSNILIRAGQPVIIDFQGMRPGPAAYDLASLLCDPYVMLDTEERTALTQAYCCLSPQGNAVAETFAAAAVQRLCQALGAYGRLAALPSTSRFSCYIPPACAMLTAMLKPLTPAHALLRALAPLTAEFYT